MDPSFNKRPQIINSPKLSRNDPFSLIDPNEPIPFDPFNPFTPNEPFNPFNPPPNIHGSLPFMPNSDLLVEIAYCGKLIREGGHYYPEPMDNNFCGDNIRFYQCVSCSRNNLRGYLNHKGNILCLMCTDNILNEKLVLTPKQKTHF